MSTLPIGDWEQLAGVVDQGELRVDNSSRATWAVDAGGRTWVRKHVQNTGIEPLLSEALCYRFGHRLAVRQPKAAIFYDSLGCSWMSERLVSVGHWRSDLRDVLDNVAEVGRMLAMDAITGNGDRHRGNLLVEPIAADRWRGWAIDSGDALVGFIEDFEALGLNPPSAHNHLRGLPVDVIRPFALEAAIFVASWQQSVLEDIVLPACALVGEAEGRRWVDALAARC